MPFYTALHNQDSVPFGPFTSAGGSGGMYDVLGTSSTPFPEKSIQQFKDIYNGFSGLEEKEKVRWRRILNRLSQAKRRGQIEDKVLNLSISLEMMLLDDNQTNEQLSLSFRLRGTWLISNNKDERLENYNLLKNIYTYRSQIAHAGLLGKGNYTKIAAIKESFGSYQKLAEKIGMRLLITGKPDWDKVILGFLEEHQR